MNRHCVGTVDILITPTRNQKTRPHSNDDVFSEHLSPLKTSAAIERKIVAEMIGEEVQLGWRGRYRPDVVYVDETFQFRSDICIQAVTDNEGTGINKVGLAFSFAGAEINCQAVALLKIYRCPAQIEALVRVKAEWTADKKRPIQHRIETGGVRVRGIIISAGVAFPNQVLSKNIGDVNLLVPRVELIQIGKSIFLQHLEGGDVVLPAVVVVVPKNAHAQIGIVENKTAKIADEGLNAGAR